MKLLTTFAAALCGVTSLLAAPAGKKISDYTETLTLTDSWIYEIAVPGVTNYKVTFGTIATNIIARVPAIGGGSVVTNANQFGASTTLTLKSGLLLTNTLLYGSVTIPGVTALRPAFIDSDGGITHASGTPTGDKFMRDDGVLAVPPGTGAVAAPLSSVQFNSNGVMQGSPLLVYTNGKLTVAEISIWPGASMHPDSTFIGRLAGVSNIIAVATNGIYNTFIGSTAGSKNTSGYAQTFLGFAAGALNTVGNGNTFLGYQSGQQNTNGKYNVYIGVDAGFVAGGSDNNVIIGHHAGNAMNPAVGEGDNVFIGQTAGGLTSTGTKNVLIGTRSGFSNTNGTKSVIIGYLAGQYLVGDGNVLIGSEVSQAAGDGTLNTMVGWRSGYNNSSGYGDSFFGNGAGFANTSGYLNSFFGYTAGTGNSTGVENAFFGARAGFSSTISSQSTGIGANALYTHSGTGVNTALGEGAGYFLGVNGTGCLFLGNKAGHWETGDNKLFIDNTSRANEAVSRAYAMVYGVFADSPANQCFTINANVTLGTNVLVTTNRNVGIGTMAPSSSLDVTGQVRAAAAIFTNSLVVNGVTITGSGSTQMVAAAIGTLTLTNALSVDVLNVNQINLTNALSSNQVRMGYHDLTNILRRQSIHIGAAAMIPQISEGATFATDQTSSPTNRMVDSFVFSSTITNSVQFNLTMPENWDLGTVKVKLWTSSTNNIATTTNVWAISAAAIKNTSVITNINWGTEVTIKSVVSSAGGQALLTPATSALTVGNAPTAASLVWFRIRRLPGHADDNDGGQQKLLAAWVQYGETMSEVASW